MIVISGDTFADVMATAQRMYDHQVKKADETILVIQKVEPCKQLVTFSSSSLQIESYYSNRDPETSDGWDSQLAKFVAKAEAELARLKALHEQNEPIIAHNKAVIEKASIFMRAIGIPPSYGKTEYVGRNRKPVHTTIPAGYISDLSRNAITFDGYDLAVQGVNDSIRRAKQHAEEKKRGLAAAESAARREAESKKAEMVIVHMRVKYGCAVDASAKDVLGEIVGKNKYLRLAHYMQENRNDWNEGPDFARMGLDGFTVETPEDQEIYDAVSAQVEDWGGDGRVFRDMEHNYGVLFGKVEDAGLMADYQAVYDAVQRQAW